MDMTALVGVETIGRVLVATLSRPPVNAINDALVAALDAVLEHAIADPAVAVLHLRSDQRAFSAGADLALIESCFATPHGPDVMTEVVRNMQRLYRRLEAAPLLTLAEIATSALGGGLAAGGVDVGNDHPCTLARQCLCRRAADAGAGAGDDRGLVREIHGVSSFSGQCARRARKAETLLRVSGWS